MRHEDFIKGVKENASRAVKVAQEVNIGDELRGYLWEVHALIKELGGEVESFLDAVDSPREDLKDWLPEIRKAAETAQGLSTLLNSIASNVEL
jgi:hypothetical protein